MHEAPPSDWNYTERFDALGKGCGEVLLDLKLTLGALAPGTVVLAITDDAGAPVEIPAWCGLTGHALLDAAHPNYLIERRAGP
jgi:tRNA 2-thiouridine synthesizing protein A